MAFIIYDLSIFLHHDIYSKYCRAILNLFQTKAVRTLILILFFFPWKKHIGRLQLSIYTSTYRHVQRPCVRWPFNHRSFVKCVHVPFPTVISVQSLSSYISLSVNLICMPFAGSVHRNHGHRRHAQRPVQAAQVLDAKTSKFLGPVHYSPVHRFFLSKGSSFVVDQYALLPCPFG